MLPRSPGHHYGSQRHYAMLETGDVLYVGTQHKLMELEVIDTGKKAEPRPELGKGTYLTIRTVADELEVDGETVKNAEVLLYCEPDTRIAVKSRY